MKGRRYFYRSAGACPPRALDHADDGEAQGFPPPYDEGGAFCRDPVGAPPSDERQALFFRSAGACPPRALERADDGEGQALALR